MIGPSLSELFSRLLLLELWASSHLNDLSFRATCSFILQLPPFFLPTQSAKAKSCQFHQIIQNPFKFSRYHYHAHYCYWISPLAFSEPTKINIHTRTYINTYFKRVRPPLPLLPITIMYIDCDLSMGHYHCEYIFWIFLYFYYIHNVLPFHYSNIVIICVSLISFVIITIPLLDLN